jgi:hypothetical protein
MKTIAVKRACPSFTGVSHDLSPRALPRADETTMPDAISAHSNQTDGSRAVEDMDAITHNAANASPIIPKVTTSLSSRLRHEKSGASSGERKTLA